MSYRNGKTALTFVARETDASIKDIDKCLATGFPGCPPEGANFHFAIGRAMKAQLMFQGVQIDAALKRAGGEEDRARETLAPEVDLSGRWGRIRAKGSQSMRPVIQIVAIIAVSAVCWKLLSEIEKVRTVLNKVETEEAQR